MKYIKFGRHKGLTTEQSHEVRQLEEDMKLLTKLIKIREKLK